MAVSPGAADGYPPGRAAPKQGQTTGTEYSSYVYMSVSPEAANGYHPGRAAPKQGQTTETDMCDHLPQSWTTD